MKVPSTPSRLADAIAIAAAAYWAASLVVVIVVFLLNSCCSFPISLTVLFSL